MANDEYVLRMPKATNTGAAEKKTAPTRKRSPGVSVVHNVVDTQNTPPPSKPVRPVAVMPDAPIAAALPNHMNPVTTSADRVLPTATIDFGWQKKRESSPKLAPIARDIPDPRKTASLHNGTFGSKQMIEDDFLRGFNEDVEDE